MIGATTKADVYATTVLPLRAIRRWKASISNKATPFDRSRTYRPTAEHRFFMQNGGLASVDGLALKLPN
jgi:hypothetical protein